MDLGTSFVGAAIARPSGVEMVTLAPHSVLAPALVFLRENGTIATGDAASRRAVTRPDRAGRELMRHLGDPAPKLLGGERIAIPDLLGALLRSVLRQVVTLEGRNPERVVLTHPASWGPSRRALFEQIPGFADLPDAVAITDAEAAGQYFATTRRPNDGQVFAVYDLGGGSFEATVIRGAPTADGRGVASVEILGQPEGIARLGGVDFDESVWSFVNDSCGGALDGLDVTHLQATLALAHLRQECVLAKESLSSITEATIPVALPDQQLEVTLTRTDFEDMVRARIQLTIEALSQTLRSANVESSELSAVLLVGGSSRIPLVAQTLAQELNCPTVTGTDPQNIVALGAAMFAAASTDMDDHAGLPASIPSAADTTIGPGRAGATGSRRGVVAFAAPSSPLSEAAATSATVSHQSPGASPAALTNQDSPGHGAESRGTSSHLPGGSPNADGNGDPRRGADRSVPDWGRMLEQPAAPLGTYVRSRAGRSAQRRWLLAVGTAAVLVVLIALGVAVAFAQRPPSSIAAGVVPTAPPEPAPTSPIPPPAPSIAQPQVAGTVAVAGGPQSGAITPDGKLVYITIPEAHSITVLDTATNAVVGSVAIPQGPPQYVAFTPDGLHAYVSVYDEIRGIGSAVVQIDTATRQVVVTIPAEKFPYAIAVSPDGRQLYVPNHDVNLVSVVDTATNAVVRKIEVKPNPHSVAYSVNGRRAYVANHASNLVTVLDTKNGAILNEIPVGKSPHSIAMSPDRTKVYVVNYDGDSVSVIDPASNAVTATIPVQREPQSIAFAPDSKHAYVVNDGSNTVSVIDTTTNLVTATVGTGQDPTNVFVTPDGKHAYVTNISSNNVTVLNTAG